MAAGKVSRVMTALDRSDLSPTWKRPHAASALPSTIDHLAAAEAHGRLELVNLSDGE